MMFNVEFNEDSCHICLSNDGTKEHIDENDLKQKYLELTSVEVLHAKGMPSYICEFCKSKLIIAVHFKKQCMMSHKLLKKHFEEINKAGNAEVETIIIIDTLDETENHNVVVPEPNPEEIVQEVEECNEAVVLEDVAGEAVKISEMNVAKKRRRVVQRRRVTRPKKQRDIELIELEEIDEEEEQGEMEQMTIEVQKEIVNTTELTSNELLHNHLEDITKAKNDEIDTVIEETDLNIAIPEPIPEDVVSEVGEINELVVLKEVTEDAVNKPEKKVAKKRKHVAQKRRVNRPIKQREIELIELEEIEEEEDQEEMEQNTIEVQKEIVNTTEPTIIELDDYKIQIGGTDDEENEDDESKSHSDKKETCIGIIELKGMKNMERTTDGKKYKVFDGKRVSYMSLCPICDKMQFNIKQHMSVHTGEKKHKCPHCNKAFAQKGNLKHHINIHTGNKPYKCKVCDKSFSEPNSLRSHMVFHTKEKKYHCEVCDKKFGYPHTLTAHKRTHTNERPYSCTICNKSFLVRHTLTKHIRSHTGEKPYKCETCGKAFTSSGNLSAHRIVHTKIRRFDCHICPMKFSYKNVLKTHMKVHKIGLDDARDPDEASAVTDTEENTESE